MGTVIPGIQNSEKIPGKLLYEKEFKPFLVN